MGPEVRRLVGEMTEARRRTFARLLGLSDGQLAAVTKWAERECEVRFILHRFSDHEKEHTVHLEKAMQALGIVPSEAQRILARAEESRGRLLGLLLALRDEDLDRRAGEGEWSICEILNHVVETEELYLSARILKAIEAQEG